MTLWEHKGNKQFPDKHSMKYVSVWYLSCIFIKIWASCWSEATSQSHGRAGNFPCRRPTAEPVLYKFADSIKLQAKPTETQRRTTINSPQQIRMAKCHPDTTNEGGFANHQFQLDVSSLWSRPECSLWLRPVSGPKGGKSRHALTLRDATCIKLAPAFG